MKPRVVANSADAIEPLRLVSPSRIQVEEQVREIEGWIAGIRGELDDLWFVARDASSREPAFTKKSNRRAADQAAFNLLQCLRQLQQHVEQIGRIV